MLPTAEAGRPDALDSAAAPAPEASPSKPPAAAKSAPGRLQLLCLILQRCSALALTAPLCLVSQCCSAPALTAGSVPGCCVAVVLP